MHRTFSVPRLIGWSSLFVLLIFCIGPSATNAQQVFQPVSFAQAAPDIQQTTGTVTLTVGTTQTYMMTTKGNLKKVENPNSKVLDVRAIPQRVNEVQLVAIGPGRARVTFTDVNDKVEVIDVVVINDRVKDIREALARSLPTASVTVTSTDSGGTIILTGTVLTVEDMRSLQKLVPDGPGVINNVRIGGVQTVTLEVVVALVNRSELRQISFSWTLNGFNWFTGSLLSGNTFTNALTATSAGASASQAGTANIPFGVLNSNGNFMGFLQALRTEGLAKVLAEPRVTTLSGRPAYITSGGEVPVVLAAGAGSVPSVTYKTFGTLVHFLPVVLGNGKIHLEVRPELSARDASLDLNVAGVNAPGFRSRSAQVTVQIDDGQTLAIGGLTQNTVNASISRVPILGDLPGLGVFFTNKSFREDEEELIILVTPRLVDPVDCTKFPKYLPGRETRPPDDFELFLEGILEAPRGPRNVVFHPHLYKPAYHNAPNIGQIPCADGSCNSCSTCNKLSLTRRPVYTSSNLPAVEPMPTPNFPTVQSMPMSSYRVTTVEDMPAPAPGPLPRIRSAPGFGPVTPTSMPSMPPPREFEKRPSILPPISPGVFGPR